jgi:hypothetical protein
MRRAIAALSTIGIICFVLILPQQSEAAVVSISQYVRLTERTPGNTFCTRYDSGEVEQVYARRENYRGNLHGAFQTRRQAARKAVPTCPAQFPAYDFDLPNL